MHDGSRNNTALGSLAIGLMIGASVAGCTPEPDEVDGYHGGIALPGEDSDSDDGLGGAFDGDGGDAEGESGDGGDGLEPEPVFPADGCYAVDLLFVIDNSGSMCEFQENLAQVAPQMVDAIFESLPRGTDVHVGITTTSFSHGGTHMEKECRAAEADSTVEQAYITDHVVDFNGYQGRLFEYAGQRFGSARTDQDSSREQLTQWFSEAVVEVGCSGGAFDFSAAAAAYAVDPVNSASNAGFLRDKGAVLAIFTLTNETDHSPEGLTTYRDAILNAKAECGGEDCILTAGLLAPNCVPDYNPYIWQFLNIFGSAPVWGDIKDPSVYGEVVAQTLSDGLTETCEQIPPVG